MQILRTPDERFDGLTDYPFEPHYTDITTHDGSALRIHHLEEGPADGPQVLLMHGQPVWSYLYRKMIPLLTAAGMRVIAPDLPGYGRSDKPADRLDYTYERQVDWMGQWLVANDFRGLTFFGQDWGGLIGLRMVVEHDERFARVAISNTGLPYNPDTPQAVLDEIEEFRNNAPTPTLQSMSAALRDMVGDPARKFAYWQKFCWETVDIPIGFMMSMTMEQRSRMVMAVDFFCHRLGIPSPVRSSLARGYEAPFPDASYKMGPRAMPSQVPMLSTSPSLESQAQAWAFFEQFEKPFLCAFADNDPVTAGGQQQFLDKVPGTRGLPHTTIKGGGHFVQEIAPEQVSAVIVDLIRNN
ncbi:MAG: haloalkane dehalogenase [Pseudomonadota bacterium]